MTKTATSSRTTTRVDLRRRGRAPSEELTGVDFRLLGTRVRLDGPPRALHPYIETFQRFAVTEEPREPDVSIRILTDGRGERVLVQENGKREEHRFDEGGEALGFVYAWLLDRVTRGDPALLCIHAAALEKGGKGIVVAAPSRHGKSTLSIALAAHGFAVLSDEVAAIDRRSLRLRPFPLPVGCRPGAERLLGGSFPRDPGVRVGQTLLIRAMETRPAALHAVVFLSPERGDERASRRYRMVLHPRAERLAPVLAAVEGVASAEAEPGGRAIRITLGERAWVAPAVERLLAKEGVLVLDVEDLDAPRPRFEGQAERVEIGTAEGVVELLRHLRGFAAIEGLAASSPGGFGGLVSELVREMRAVRFSRLRPGRLAGMIRAIETLV